MAFAPHIRMTALGRLGGQNGERFSYGLNLASINAVLPGLQPNQDVWNDLAEELAAFHARPATGISGRAVLEVVKFARIGADGSYTEDPVIVDVANTPGGVAANDSAQTLPQSALVVSFTSARRGPTGKGRFYVPMPVFLLDADTFQITDAARDGVTNSAVTLVNELGNQPGVDVLDLRVVVASSKGYNTPVTGVRVGRIIDTVRSRRRSLSEAYDPPAAVTQND